MEILKAIMNEAKDLYKTFNLDDKIDRQHYYTMFQNLDRVEQ